jgi:hypothetical protein
MLAAQDVAVRCKELGITALHVKIRATGGTSSQALQSNRATKLMLLHRQRHQDARPRCSVRSPRSRPCRHEDWPYRGRHPNPIRLHAQKGWSSWSSSLSDMRLEWGCFIHCLPSYNLCIVAFHSHHLWLEQVTHPRGTATFAWSSILIVVT